MNKYFNIFTYIVKLSFTNILFSLLNFPTIILLLTAFLIEEFNFVLSIFFVINFSIIFFPTLQVLFEVIYQCFILKPESSDIIKEFLNILRANYKKNIKLSVLFLIPLIFIIYYKLIGIYFPEFLYGFIDGLIIIFILLGINNLLLSTSAFEDVPSINNTVWQFFSIKTIFYSLVLLLYFFTTIVIPALPLVFSTSLGIYIIFKLQLISKKRA